MAPECAAFIQQAQPNLFSVLNDTREACRMSSHCRARIRANPVTANEFGLGTHLGWYL